MVWFRNLILWRNASFLLENELTLARGRRFLKHNAGFAAACSDTLWSDRHRNRSCRVAAPFCKLTLTGLRLTPPAYPKELKILGDWIRKTRLDQKLTQAQAGQILGVSECCVTNWELGHTEPEVRYIPKIIEFIGYCSYDTTAEPIDRIEVIRRALGQTQEEFAHILGVDESSLASWVRREHKPGRHSLEIIRSFLTSACYWDTKLTDQVLDSMNDLPSNLIQD